MPAMPRLTLLTVIAALAVAGCAHQPPARTTTTVTTTRSHTAPVTPASSASTPQTSHRPATNNSPANSATTRLPSSTGIAACDDYLSSYLACHRAANIFAPGQLQSRYNAMRTSLLRDSQDPDIRPQLAARCNSLASQLRDALHGKPCDTNAAPASTSP